MKTIQDLKDKIKGLASESMTFAEFTERKNYFINQKIEVIAILESLTVKELKQFYYGRPDDKKANAVNSVYDAFISSFLMSDSVSYSPFSGQTYEGELMKKLNSQTEEQFLKWREEKQAEKKALLKALDNPETIDEFRTFILYKGEDKLSSEQKAVYDDLRANSNKEQRKREEVRSATIQAVPLENVKMDLHDSKHTKTGENLYVVTLSQRVERDKYTELNSKAKKLGGYYSSYAKGGAIPGFTFKDKKAAELFMDLKEGNVNAGEIREERKQVRTLSKAETLKERAQQIEDKANEELSRERKTNTHKRAGEAQRAEENALANIKFAKTLRAIAEGIEHKTIKYLGELSTLTELEELQNILYQAKHDHINKENLKRDEYQYSVKTAEFCKYPFPYIFKSNVLHLLEKLKEDKGKKLAANRMLKHITNIKDDGFYVVGASALEDYRTLFCNMSANLDTWAYKSMKERILRYDRIQRLGLNSIEELRAAIRELISIKAGAKPSEKLLKEQAIKEAERKFLGMKGNGFFPTPEELAKQLVKSARIEEGQTILEPSAGLGHIAEAISEAHPDNKLICVEQSSGLVEVLKMKGFEVKHEDFLKLNGGVFYDRIIMNPPFEDLQDVDHVKHAFHLLKSGGRLVAIVANNKQGERSKCREFMELIDKYGSMEANESGAFKSAFNPTGVNTCTVILDKP